MDNRIIKPPHIPARKERFGAGDRIKRQPPRIRIGTEKEETFDASANDDYADAVAAFAERLVPIDASFPVDAPMQRLAVAVIVRTLDDACGIGVRPDDHPWTDSGNGHRTDRWITEQTHGLSESDRKVQMAKKIARDAMDFLTSPKRAGDKRTWFRLAGFMPPKPDLVPAMLKQWEAARISGGDVSSRASMRSRPPSSSKSSRKRRHTSDAQTPTQSGDPAPR